VAQPFRTVYGSFVTDSGPSRAALADPTSAQLRPPRPRVGNMLRAKSVLGIDLVRWCTLRQTHQRILGIKKPARAPAVPSERLRRWDFTL
jgi:hypothetical protein